MTDVLTNNMYGCHNVRHMVFTQGCKCEYTIVEAHKLRRISYGACKLHPIVPKGKKGQK